jgi:hypothetical protein
MFIKFPVSITLLPDNKCETPVLKFFFKKEFCKFYTHKTEISEDNRILMSLGERMERQNRMWGRIEDT